MVLSLTCAITCIQFPTRLKLINAALAEVESAQDRPAEMLQIDNMDAGKHVLIGTRQLRWGLYRSDRWYNRIKD